MILYQIKQYQALNQSRNIFKPKYYKKTSIQLPKLSLNLGKFVGIQKKPKMLKSLETKNYQRCILKF